MPPAMIKFGSSGRLAFVNAWIFLGTIGESHSAFVLRTTSSASLEHCRRHGFHPSPGRSLRPSCSPAAPAVGVGYSPRKNHAAAREAFLTSRFCAGTAPSPPHGESGSLQPIPGKSLLASSSGMGLYRPIAELVWNKIVSTGWMENIDIPSELASNQAPARGMKAGDWVTRIETRALTATGGRSPCGGVLSPEHPLSYARMALIETIPVNFDNSDGEGEGPWTGQDSNASNCVHSLGIQVLNIVIFPSPTSRLPVWGADFVSLPGDRHLLLLDAQPMDARARGGDVSPFDRHWDAWRKKSAIDAMFPWGGDLPDPVKPYVSSNALWTKMNITAMATENMILGPIEHITQSLPRVVESHLDIYLRLVSQFYVDSEMTDNSQRDYINYRLRNDPARPMLKSLYGEDWTDVVLKQVLFPPLHT